MEHPTVNVIRNLEGVPAESADLYAAAEWFKAEGYRIVKLVEVGLVPVVGNAPEFGEKTVHEIVEEL